MIRWANRIQIMLAARRNIAKADDAQSRRAEDFKTPGRFERGFGVFGQIAPMRRQMTKPVQAEHLNRHPNLESAESSRQRDAVIGMERFLGGVERAGADVAIDDADAAERQARYACAGMSRAMLTTKSCDCCRSSLPV
jgi:hypothetical protein